VPREAALIPVAILWLVLSWDALVRQAIANGDTYLMPEATRRAIVVCLGYGPLTLQGLLILRKLRRTHLSQTEAATTQKKDS